MENNEFMKRALDGDAEITRMYCGAYTLVESPNGGLYRCKGDIPPNYTKVEGVYDIDGFLYSRFWSLPRL